MISIGLSLRGLIMDEVYQEGRNAFEKWIANDCKGSIDNPYPENTEEGSLWQYGWDDCDDWYNYGQYEL